MDPGPVWRGMDAADRVGIAEAKHITGLYKFLDDMRARFPDILQENCASGGRRIDLEMISRAHTYCRSDYYIGRKPKRYRVHSGAECDAQPHAVFAVPGLRVQLRAGRRRLRGVQHHFFGDRHHAVRFRRRDHPPQDHRQGNGLVQEGLRCRGPHAAVLYGRFLPADRRNRRRRRRLVCVAMRPAGFEGGIRDLSSGGALRRRSPGRSNLAESSPTRRTR